MSLMRRVKIWLGAVACFVVPVMGASAADQKPIEMGWINWSDAEIVAKLAAKAIEDQTGRPVKLVMADLGMQFQALAAGHVDVIPMVWLPGAHKSYWDKYGKQLEDLGVIYDGRIGWAIPDSVPASEVSSIADLNKPGIAAKFGNRILASEAGTGQYKLSEKAIADYGLKGYTLTGSSEVGMLTAFGRDVGQGKWAILNAWNPHWMFSKWKLRYLDDPKQVFGSTEHIHVVGRPGFTKDEPRIANFLKHYTLPLPELEGMLMEAKDSTPEKVVDAYYAKNKARFAAMFD